MFVLKRLLVSVLWLCSLVQRNYADIDCPQCFRKDHFLYLYIDQKTSYAKARQVCHAHGGRLIGIDSSDLQDTIVQFFNDANIKTPAFIGVTDFVDEGTWVTADQEINPYEDGWKDKQDKNQGKKKSDGKDCVVLEGDEDRKWVTISCDQRQPYLCEVLNLAEEDCPSGCFHQNNWISHVTYDTKTTWLKSRRVCIDRGGDLIKMNDVLKEAIKDVIQNNKNYKPHTFWTFNAPDPKFGGTKDSAACGTINKKEWGTQNCDEEIGTLCFFQNIETRMEGKEIPSVSKLREMRSPCVEFFGICYYFIKEKKDYEGAQQDCSDGGGKFVNEPDNLFLLKYLALTAYRNSTLNEEEQYYIGYRYQKDKESWEDFKKHLTILELFLRRNWNDDDNEISDDQCFVLQKSSTYMLEPVDCGESYGFICQDLKFCKGAPEPKDNETNIDFDPNEPHRKGVKRTYNCKEGFYFEDTDVQISLEITCNGDNWDQQAVPKCIKICGDLPQSKDNDTVEKFDRDDPISKGDEKTYECKAGYYFENTDTQTSLTLTCDGKQWNSNDIPGCIKICGDLPQSKDNDTVEKFDRDDPISKGDEKTYECKAGYYFENTDSQTSLTLTCDGKQWNQNEVPGCIKGEERCDIVLGMLILMLISSF